MPAPTAQMNVNLSSGELLGRGIQRLSRTIEDMKGKDAPFIMCGALTIDYSCVHRSDSR